jgi:hypothetical protein
MLSFVRRKDAFIRRDRLSARVRFSRCRRCHYGTRGRTKSITRERVSAAYAHSSAGEREEREERRGRSDGGEKAARGTGQRARDGKGRAELLIRARKERRM